MRIKSKIGLALRREFFLDVPLPEQGALLIYSQHKIQIVVSLLPEISAISTKDPGYQCGVWSIYEAFSTELVSRVWSLLFPIWHSMKKLYELWTSAVLSCCGGWFLIMCPIHAQITVCSFSEHDYWLTGSVIQFTCILIL